MKGMYIKMLKNKPGAEQGVHVKLYVKGESYPVSEELGKALVECKAAEQIKFLPKPPKPEKKEEKKDKGKGKGKGKDGE